MSPILRSVLQHVTRGGRSLSTDFRPSVWSRRNEAGETVVSRLLSRAYGLSWGYAIGAIVLKDPAREIEKEWQQKLSLYEKMLGGTEFKNENPIFLEAFVWSLPELGIAFYFVQMLWNKGNVAYVIEYVSLAPKRDQ